MPLWDLNYSNALKPHLGPFEKLYFFWKGRVALFACLKALDIGPGDEVVLPALTCVVVPSAILYTGATPIYVDVDPETLLPTTSAMKAAVNPKTKVMITQNTFGLSQDTLSLSRFCKDHGIWTIEDCTHGFGGKTQGLPNGSLADASFFSTQWNKPFSTGLGGILQLNNPELITTLDNFCKHLSGPSRLTQWGLTIQLWLNHHLITDQTYWMARRVYRGLSRLNLITGSSQGTELETPTQPKDYLLGMSPVQMKAGLRALQTFPALQAHRRQGALQIHFLLKKWGKTTVPEDSLPKHGFLLYPLLVKDREVFFSAAEEAHIQLIDWFSSPLHPVPLHHLHAWKFDARGYPNATFLAQHLCGLPTPLGNTETLLHFLSVHKDSIL